MEYTNVSEVIRISNDLSLEGGIYSVIGLNYSAGVTNYSKEYEIVKIFRKPKFLSGLTPQFLKNGIEDVYTPQ